MEWKPFVIMLIFLLTLFINIHAQERWNQRYKGDRSGKCPKPGFGACANLCFSDRDCPGKEKCCSNGCGHTCTAPVSVGYQPGKCPELGFGICADLCSTDRDCHGKEKCCSYGCKHICMAPVYMDVCQLPKEVGQCYSKERRYYFNKKTGRCRSFDYGGCGGNENNFRSRRSCRERCERKKNH